MYEIFVPLTEFFDLARRLDDSTKVSEETFDKVKVGDNIQITTEIDNDIFQSVTRNIVAKNQHRLYFT